jgi:hypothetical protein
LDSYLKTIKELVFECDPDIHHCFKLTNPISDKTQIAVLYFSSLL